MAPKLSLEQKAARAKARQIRSMAAAKDKGKVFKTKPWQGTVLYGTQSEPQSEPQPEVQPQPAPQPHPQPFSMPDWERSQRIAKKIQEMKEKRAVKEAMEEHIQKKQEEASQARIAKKIEEAKEKLAVQEAMEEQMQKRREDAAKKREEAARSKRELDDKLWARWEAYSKTCWKNGEYWVPWSVYRWASPEFRQDLYHNGMPKAR